MEADLARELSLDQIRNLHTFDVPGLHEDLEEGRVVDEDVEVVGGAKPLGPFGSTCGIREPTTGAVVPVAPWLAPMPGHYAARLLPRSRVALELAPCDDEEALLARHRADLLALQGVTERDLTASAVGVLDPVQRRACFGVALGAAFMTLFAYVRLRAFLFFGWEAALAIAGVVMTSSWVWARTRKPRVLTGVLERSGPLVTVDGRRCRVPQPLHGRLVPGVRYRVHFAAGDCPTFEPVLSGRSSGSPYR